MNIIKQYWIKYYVNAEKLHKLLTKDGHRISKKQVTDFLNEQLTHQLHKPIRRRFDRRSIIVSGPNVMWDVDLLDLKEFQGSNYKYRYIVTVVDVFSRKAYGEAITNKTAKTTAVAFGKIVDTIKPVSVRTDHGNEFKREFNTLLKNKSIKHILTSSPEIKANYVERFHRTFRDKLMKYMTYNSTKNWTRIYKKIIETYNNTPHTSLKSIAPNEVNNTNISQLLEYMLDKEKQKRKDTKLFAVGDLVRITKLKKHFAKASKENFTDELFKIVAVSKGKPKIYRLSDLTGEPIVGGFYASELQLAETDAITHKRVAKAINTGKSKYKVHFKNWPRKFDIFCNKKELKFYEQPK